MGSRKFLLWRSKSSEIDFFFFLFHSPFFFRLDKISSVILTFLVIDEIFPAQQFLLPLSSSVKRIIDLFGLLMDKLEEANSQRKSNDSHTFS